MQVSGIPPNSTSAGQGWPSVAGTMDGGRRPCLSWRGKRPVSRPADERTVFPKFGLRSLRSERCK